MFKQKRAFTGEGATNTPAHATAHAAAQATTVQEQAKVTLGPQETTDNLLQISVDQAL